MIIYLEAAINLNQMLTSQIQHPITAQKQLKQLNDYKRCQGVTIQTYTPNSIHRIKKVILAWNPITFVPPIPFRIKLKQRWSLRYILCNVYTYTCIYIYKHILAQLVPEFQQLLST